MMNQTFEEDELQKAIDDITKESMNNGPVAIGSNIPSIPPASGSSDNLNNLIEPNDLNGNTTPPMGDLANAPDLGNPIPPAIPPLPNDFGAPAPMPPEPGLPPQPSAPQDPPFSPDGPAPTPLDQSSTPSAPAMDQPPIPDGPNPNLSPDSTIPTPEAPILDPASAPDLSAPSSPSPDLSTPEPPQPDLNAPSPLDQPQTPNTNLPSDLQSVKEKALQDLSPLLHNLNIEPEKKFQIYRDIIETVGDNSAFGDAYDAASQITDENKRAESLLEIVQLIDDKSA